MLGIFKSTRMLYLIGVVGVIIDFPLVTKDSATVLFSLVFRLVWMALVVLVASLIAAFKLSKINALRDELKFEEYIETNIKLLEQVDSCKLWRKLNQSNRSMLLCNLSTGYFDQGSNEKAYKALTAIDYFPKAKAGAIYKFVYNNNLFVYHVRQENINEASDCLDKMKAILEESKFNKKQKDNFKDLYTGNCFVLNAAKGDYEGYQEYAEVRVKKDKTLVRKLADSCGLGEACLHYGKFEQASEILSYVVDNGKNSYYATKAKELLTKIK